mgnify:CR=1 FL=1
MAKKQGIKKQKSSLRKKLIERKNHLLDVKTQLQTCLQLLKQEEQEIIHMENKMLAKIKEKKAIVEDADENFTENILNSLKEEYKEKK